MPRSWRMSSPMMVLASGLGSLSIKLLLPVLPNSYSNGHDKFGPPAMSWAPRSHAIKDGTLRNPDVAGRAINLRDYVVAFKVLSRHEE